MIRSEYSLVWKLLSTVHSLASSKAKRTAAISIVTVIVIVIQALRDGSNLRSALSDTEGADLGLLLWDRTHLLSSLLTREQVGTLECLV